jgi:hypothetical protein
MIASNSRASVIGIKALLLKQMATEPRTAMA